MFRLSKMGLGLAVMMSNGKVVYCAVPYYTYIVFRSSPRIVAVVS